jgi:hypothetical protein
VPGSTPEALLVVGRAVPGPDGGLAVERAGVERVADDGVAVGGELLGTDEGVVLGEADLDAVAPDGGLPLPEGVLFPPAEDGAVEVGVVDACVPPFGALERR